MEVIELKKVCAICVAEFEPVKVFQKYCSKSCAQTVNYKPRTKFKNVCAVCGADFEGKKGKKYCSKRCKDKAIYRKKIASTQRPVQGNFESGKCYSCWKKFKRKFANEKFCSDACRGDYFKL